MVDPALKTHASDFATSLNTTLEDVLGQAGDPYLIIQAKDNHVVVISQDPKGIQLYVQSQPVYRLRVDYRCTWNSTEQFLAIHKSTYQLAIDDYPEPVLRFDFVKDAQNVPISHINIHSHHPGLQKAMASAKPNSRANKAGDDTSKLHIPTGGLRFRPTLEDVLEMLVREFNVDTVATWKRSIKQGRKTFRDAQLAAAVGDNPGVAVSALEELGYAIYWEDQETSEPTPRDSKLEVY